MNVFNNDYDIPYPEDADDIEQLYTFKDALEEKVRERDDEDLQDVQRISTKRLTNQKKNRKKLFRVSKLIRQKEANTSILTKLDRLSFGMTELKGDMVALKGDMVALKGDMIELKGDMVDVKSTLKRLCFNDAITQNIRRRQMGLPLQKVPFIVGDGPTSQVSSIQSLQMIDMLSLRNCQYLLAGYGEDPQNMTLLQMKLTLRDLLGFMELKDARFQFSEN